MSNPTLSIIIPAYNASSTINLTVSSILSQSYGDFELLLVNDGSTDDTLIYLNKLREQDSRIKVISKENGGPSSARNSGLSIAKGKYIQFYDAGDRIESNALKLLVEEIERSGSQLVVSGWGIDLQTKNGVVRNYKQIFPKKRLIVDNLKELVTESIGSSGELYNLWNKLFVAEIIRKNRLSFRNDVRFGEDLIFSLEYFNSINAISIISPVTYHYLASSSTSVFSKSSLISEFRKINDQSIIDFVGDNPADRLFDHLQWVRWRWLISYWMIVAGSGVSKNEKGVLISDFKPEKLTVSNKSGVLSYKKLALERIASLAVNSPGRALIIGKILATTKNSIRKFKTLLKPKLN